MIGRKSFTMMEVVITVVIIGILATVGGAASISIVNKSKRMVCEQNQVIIMKALKMYIHRHGAVPVSLAKLYPEYTDIAIAQLKKDEPEKLRMRNIYLAIISLSKAEEAVAQPAFRDFISEPTVLRCPCGSGALPHYAFNNAIAAAADPWDAFENLEDTDGPIICDRNAATFTGAINGASYRHGRLGGENVAVAVGGRTIRTISPSHNWNNPVWRKDL